MTQLVPPRTADRRPATPELFSRGLQRYIDEVADCLGVGRDSCQVNMNPPVSVHLTLRMTLSHHPGRELSLLWEEKTGWLAALGAPGSSDLTVLAYHGGDLLPYPADVTAFVGTLVGGRRTGQRMPPRMTEADRDDMAYRLLSYSR